MSGTTADLSSVALAKKDLSSVALAKEDERRYPPIPDGRADCRKVPYSIQSIGRRYACRGARLSDATFIAYIDESGDEGFVQGSGASQWFVLAGVVLKRPVEFQECALVDAVRNGINAQRPPERRIPPRKPLHFRDLRHEQRRFYCEHINQADLKTVCVMVNKHDIASPETFVEESRLYFYTVRLLLERISWYCRDHKLASDPGDGSVDIYFSNRASMDYGELKAYLKYLEANREALGYRGAKGIIRTDQVSALSAGKRMGLQIADAIACSYFKAVEANPYGLTEESYARTILSRAYRYKAQVWGYGIKVMPRETEEQRRAGNLLQGW